MTSGTGVRGTAVAVLRALLRSSVNRPVAARRAASELGRGLGAAVLAEIRWALSPPRAWLSGVAVNLVLSLAWLVVQPVEHEGGRDWVVLVAGYFSSFILADVTTTNMLGVDHIRVEKSLRDAIPIRRLLLVKNLALAVIVGLPTMALASAMTLWMETPARLLTTVPDVAVPILCWLGLGNLISVLFPVPYEPLLRRWRQRRHIKRTIRWLLHLALPYALYYLADPVYGLPRIIVWTVLPAALGSTLGPGAGYSLIHIGFAAVVWMTGLALAELVARSRSLQTSPEE
ncbi:hypothetical protein J3E61_003767 [Mycobacterium sp. OAE908]|uniref:hypothetical protein n=1 Tax=Mycobacterium sp. OAE908 TaxID=2817899 RepID=UPI0034E1F10F